MSNNNHQLYAVICLHIRNRLLMKLHSFANAVDKHSVSCGYVSMGLVAIKALIYIYICDY